MVKNLLRHSLVAFEDRSDHFAEPLFVRCNVFSWFLQASSIHTQDPDTPTGSRRSGMDRTGRHRGS